MKRVKLALSALVFVSAVGSAFATRPVEDRNLYTKVTSDCHLIMCRTSRINQAAACSITDTKYTNATCTSVFSGSAWVAPTE